LVEAYRRYNFEETGEKMEVAFSPAELTAV